MKAGVKREGLNRSLIACISGGQSNHVVNKCFRCSVLENIRVRRAGYCYRQKYEIFLERLVFVHLQGSCFFSMTIILFFVVA